MKKVLITGASEGIGRALAKAFAKDNYQVVAIARNAERLQNLMQELGSPNHKFIAADLSQNKDIQKICDVIASEKFDVLINNAGFGLLGDFNQMSNAKLDEMLKLNCVTLMQLSQSYLKNAKSGDALINVASVLAFNASPFHTVYAATKAFVKSFSEGLWFEQKKRGVYVMALCPGATITEFNKRAGGSDDRIPKFALQTADQVVAVTMKALAKRKDPVVIPGFLNNFIVHFSSVFPRKSFISAAGKQAEKVIV